uniref:Chromatin complexes subunit BAP18 n=1 Tax=Phallusia mammillata TaxID=59560 RepID=A0A6F9D811_9ASCI|nr:chromatin complexes subunit BAP18 [Phallusia mammillata]
MSSNTTAAKVSQIFVTAGEAFTKLSELTMQINTQVEAPPGSKWTDEEVEMLRNAVNTFGTDLNKISEVVKTRSMTQLKNAIKRKIYSEAGMAVTKKQPQARKRSSVNETVVTESIPAETVSFNDFTSNLEIETKRQKVTSMTNSFNAGNDSLVDVENLDEVNSSFKKIDKYISEQPAVESRTVGGVNELSVSHPPPMPPFDLVSDPS